MNTRITLAACAALALCATPLTGQVRRPAVEPFSAQAATAVPCPPEPEPCPKPDELSQAMYMALGAGVGALLGASIAHELSGCNSSWLGSRRP